MAPLARLAALVAMLTSPAAAQVPNASFQLIGHIERFTLAPGGGAIPPATMTVRGQSVTLPAGLLIIMPGGYATARQLFRGQPKSGLALADAPAVPFEADIIGNVTAGKYVAGVVRLSQGALHTGAGFIQDILPNGELRIGAKGGNDGARVRLNDPKGVYGPKNSERMDIPLDARFALDPDNSPVHAKTGFPVCVPRLSAAANCREANRPSVGSPSENRFTCNNGDGGAAIADAPKFAGCDPKLFVPLRKGDYVTYVGMLHRAPNGSFIVAAHGLDAEIGVYTSPGREPAYLFIEEALQGTLGEKWPAPIDSEETTRFRIVGFTTDPSRNVRVEIVDVGRSGQDRTDFTGPAGLAPSNGPQLGRFRKTWPAKDDARGVRRDVRATIVGAQVAPLPNGLMSAQYVAPISEYIYSEPTTFGIPGYALPVPFENFCFLAVNGGTVGTSSGDVVASRLNPFPESGHALAQQVGTSSRRACD